VGKQGNALAGQRFSQGWVGKQAVETKRDGHKESFKRIETGILSVWLAKQSRLLDDRNSHCRPGLLRARFGESTGLVCSPANTGIFRTLAGDQVSMRIPGHCLVDAHSIRSAGQGF